MQQGLQTQAGTIGAARNQIFVAWDALQGAIHYP